MAHANPEFGIACRAYRDPPVSTQLPPPASLAALRARMHDIGRRIRDDIGHTPAEAEAYRLWRTTVRQQQPDALSDALAEPRGGMHGRDPAGMRFTEPKRRLPVDVQAGRVKLDHRGQPV